MRSIDHKFALICSLFLGFCVMAQAKADTGASRLDINSATAAQLAHGMVGVGPKKALAIVEYRKAHGPFKSVDALMKVKGIGPSIVKKNRAHLFAGHAAVQQSENKP